MLWWAISEPALVEKSVEQCVYTGHPGDLVVLKNPTQVARRSWGRNKKVLATQVPEAEQVDCEGKDVI